MDKKLITLFTPVYNRAKKLVDLYNSLLAQTNSNFLWIIIDDGSTDDSANVIKKIASENKIEVIVEHQLNQGKHVAHNRGVELCTTELFVCVDSDDTLVPTAIEEIYRYYTENKEYIKNNIAGIIAWKGFSEVEKIGEFPNQTKNSSLTDLYKKHKMTGDVMLIFKTEIIKQFPFPSYAGETFLRESIIYNRIDEQYEYLILDKILYLADYYEDGLSKNAPKLDIKSPNGAAIFRWEEYVCSSTKKDKLRNLISYVFFNRLAKNNKESMNKLGWRFIPLWFLAWSGYIYYRKYFSVKRNR